MGPVINAPDNAAVLGGFLPDCVLWGLDPGVSVCVISCPANWNSLRPRFARFTPAPRIDFPRYNRLPKSERIYAKGEFLKHMDTVIQDWIHNTLSSPEAMDDTWESLKQCIKAAALATLPLVTRKRPETKFMTEALYTLQQQIRHCESQRTATILFEGHVYNRKTHLHVLRGRLHRGLRRARLNYINKQCAEAAAALRRRDLRSLYRTLREMTDTAKPPPRDYLSIPPEERHSYFRTLFAAARPPVDSALLAEMAALADVQKATKWRSQIPDSAPSVEEIRQAIAKLKTGRSPGVEGLEAELLQLGSSVIAAPLQRLCETFWAHLDHLPPDWANSEILPILKRGKPASQPSSYRPISLVSIVSKIIMHVLHARLSPMVDDTVGDYQNGFRRGRSTTDAIFTYRRLCEKYRQMQAGQLHTCFVDLTQAFDRVSWDLLWHALAISGTPERLISVIKAFYHGSSVTVRTHWSEPDQGSFTPTAGVRQGCVLSPTLFILMFDYILRLVMKGTTSYPERINWPVLGGSLLPLLGYADDIALIACNMPALQARMTQMASICSRANMQLSTKTKVQHLQAPGSSAPPQPNLQLPGLEIEATDTFLYLGSEVNSTLNLDAVIRDRLAKASAVFGQLARIWTATSLPARIKATMYLTLVRPIALYGAETWILTASQESILDVQDMRWIRRLTGTLLSQQLYNTDIRAKAQCPVPLSEVCRQYRLRYYGHLSRMAPDRAPLIALHGSAPGPRRPGRPPATWLALLAADAQTRGLTLDDLDQLAPNRDNYREKVVKADRTDGIPTRTRPIPRS